MKSSVTTLLTLFVFYVCSAQYRPSNELHFNHLYVEDGLPERSILSLLQDKEGYMWIGTLNGLVRYDGYKSKVYKFGIEGFLNINSIYEDRKGKLWVGTDRGLYGYDRSKDNFIQYDPQLTDSIYLHDGEIFSIHDDPAGKLWILLWERNNASIIHLNSKTGECERYSKEEKGVHYINATDFYNIFEDSKGCFWITSNNGLYEYNSKEGMFMPHFASADSSVQKAFNFIEEDAQQPGTLWFSATNFEPYKEEGLWRYNTHTRTLDVFRHHSDDPRSLASDSVSAIYMDKRGRIWVRTIYGLSLFEPKTGHFSNYTHEDRNINASKEYSLQYQLKEDPDGNLWCNSADGLLNFDIKTRKFTRFTANPKQADALAANIVGKLLIDRTGTLWLGVGTAGSEGVGLQWVNRSRSKVSAYTDKPGQLHHFAGGSVNQIAEAPDGTIWLACANGLYRWWPESDSFALIKLSKQQFDITVVTVDKEGLVWCGGWRMGEKDRGLYCYDPKRGAVKIYRNKEKDSTSLSSDFIGALLEDRSGNFWVGTVGAGLCRFNKQTQSFIRYPYIGNTGNIPGGNALGDSRVLAFFEDKNGTLWIGTNGGGLNKLNKETGIFSSYKLHGSIALLRIYEDSKDRLWVGAYNGGLFNFDRETNSAKRFTEKEGLLFDGAWGIVEDNFGCLWINSTRGISILNAQTGNVRTLTYANGLPITSPIGFPSLRTGKGMFIIACTNGFVTLNPDDFRPDSYAPVVHIEAIDFTKPQTGDKKSKDSSILTYGKRNVNLRYNENRITFRYVGLQYQNSNLNQYAYKLDGYDQDWVQAGTQRNVSYTNLSPGTYAFHVKAANSDGVWSTNDDVLTIIISPPWWRTWWAYVLYLALFAAALRSYIVFRSRSLLRQNRLLEEKVKHRTHQLSDANEELKTTQEEVITQRDQLANTVEELKSTQSQLIQSEKLASLGELTAGIAHEIQNPLNFVNNFSEVNFELIEEMQQEIEKGDMEALKALARDVKGNQEKINLHGKRADAIVKSMLQHSRTSSRQKEPTDINALADEYLRLSYHGLKAKDKTFNATLQRDVDESIEKINIIPQDIGRVLLNVYNNALYAVGQKKKTSGEHYEPIVSISTKKMNGKVEIRVKDNGNGIPQKVVDKIFNPFFTTKPTGQGTGLGLSLSYDIVKAHGGEIEVETTEGEFAEIIIQLPLHGASL